MIDALTSATEEAHARFPNFELEEQGTINVVLYFPWGVDVCDM